MVRSGRSVCSITVTSPRMPCGRPIRPSSRSAAANGRLLHDVDVGLDALGRAGGPDTWRSAWITRPRLPMSRPMSPGLACTSSCTSSRRSSTSISTASGSSATLRVTCSTTARARAPRCGSPRAAISSSYSSSSSSSSSATRPARWGVVIIARLLRPRVGRALVGPALRGGGLVGGAAGASASGAAASAVAACFAAFFAAALGSPSRRRASFVSTRPPLSDSNCAHTPVTVSSFCTCSVGWAPLRSQPARSHRRCGRPTGPGGGGNGR